MKHPILLPSQCKPEIPAHIFQFKTTAELDEKKALLWQEKAVASVRTALEIPAPGYNAFISGYPGSGRFRTIINLIRDIARRKKNIPDDILLIYNFLKTDRPKVIFLSAGRGKLLREECENLIKRLKKNIPSIFDSDAYRKKINQHNEFYREQHRNLLRKFEARINQENFAIVQSEDNPFLINDIMPVIAGNKVSMDVLENLAENGKFEKNEYEKLKNKYLELSLLLEIIFRRYSELEKKFSDEVERMNRETMLPFIEKYIRDIKKVFREKEVHEFFDQIKNDILENIKIFTREATLTGFSRETDTSGAENNSEAEEDGLMTDIEEILKRYRVNLLVDNSATQSPPVIVESSPSYRNLIGTVEKTVLKNGEVITDFTRIRAGSFLNASGGYLILNAWDLLEEENLWQTMKRTIRNNRVEIESPEDYKSGTVSVRPEPIPVQVRIILIGDEHIYNLLYSYDVNFRKIFKIKAHFDPEMKATASNILKYAGLVRQLSAAENVLPFDREAVMRLVEYGARLQEHQKKISARFNLLSDLIREASHHARDNGCQIVKRLQVAQTLAIIRQRKNYAEEKMLELYKDGSILLDFRGAVPGMINALTVYDVDDYSFGSVIRITAAVSPGNRGVINIEREVDLSGPVHDKGVFIISSYLRTFFSADFPLSLTSSICFEQNYSEIEGDSASLAELAVLFSALSGSAIMQNVAVTGSVNQLGDIQPVGGINEKIEGFSAILDLKNYSGKAAVIIPHQN
ncbi:MAG TPA: hypothetical protein DC049_00020, partial [Spirochaetia bacterium]|nr:hypothetical protein [Spirochaetia bacterium]